MGVHAGCLLSSPCGPAQEGACEARVCFRRVSLLLPPQICWPGYSLAAVPAPPHQGRLGSECPLGTVTVAPSFSEGLVTPPALPGALGGLGSPEQEGDFKCTLPPLAAAAAAACPSGFGLGSGCPGSCSLWGPSGRDVTACRSHKLVLGKGGHPPLGSGEG